ncbi:hydroxypyruvate reductase [Thioclava sp. SK-1]|uniref:glycerate kinase type-2 family protein n=1 Tax=Thioclava sp. SK-1 TaxID=1889770 RepID=UPI0008240B80|nr:glycerate kinase [Thioclava sp. SK-1]OCX66553.1 hydroxypyruvate reductase [Thioclava sp. SK-1]
MPDIAPAEFLRALFDASVTAADPMICVPQALGPKPAGRVVVIGAGKASARMAEALEQAWGPCEGLVITRYGYGRPLRGIRLVEAAHPVPDQAGVDATCELLTLMQGLGADDTVIALISGGGSALLCAPAGEITLAEKQAVNAALLASGATIDKMNTLRKHLSQVKGGQLAAAAFPARLISLLISDVPGDDPSFIASGPTVGDVTTAAQAIAIVERHNIALPPSVRAVLDGPRHVISPDDPRLSKAQTQVIAAPAQSLEAAAQIARAAGVKVRVLGDALEGEARDLARTQVELAQSLRDQAPIVLLSGGECTVTQEKPVPGAKGGPNAEFMLSALIALDGARGIWGIACDTDGVDGADEVAGAIIGPDTLHIAQTRGMDPVQALHDHDAHGFFAAVGAQVVPGPTLTNVNDFRAFLILPD